MVTILPPCAAGDHARADLLRQAHDAVQVCIHHSAVLLFGVLLEALADVRAGHVHQDVRSAHGLHRVGDRLRIADVQPQRAASDFRGAHLQFAPDRAASVTLAPASAMWRAMARPIPRLAPATRAVLPSKEKMRTTAL